MNAGLNIAILERESFISQIFDLSNSLNTDSLEMPVQFWQRSGLKKECLEGFRVSGLSGLLNATDIFPMSIFSSEEDFLDQVGLLKKKVAVCKELGCSNMSMGIDPWISVDINIAEDMFVERLRFLSKALGDDNININMEYISPIISSNNGEKQKTLFCNSIYHAIELIQKIKEKNINLLLDYLHWYCDPCRPDLSKILPFVGFVHVCDHKENDFRKISDGGRLLPGEGNLPLDYFIDYLKKEDFSGPLTVEVFRSKNYQPTYTDINQSLSFVKKLWGDV